MTTSADPPRARTRSAPPPDPLTATERWLIARGMPMLVEDYRSGTDVWTRALPALLVVFVLLLPVPATNQVSVVDAEVVELHLVLDWGGLLRELAVLAAFVIGYVLVNLSRRRRPFARPQRVSWWVPGAVILVPTALELVTDDDITTALAVAVTAALLVAVVYAVTRYALVALFWWAVRWTLRQLGDLVRLTTRVLPLLLLVVTFLFLSTELWQVAGTMDGRLLWSALAVFGGLGIVVLLSRVGEEGDRLDLGADRAYVLEASRGTPMAALAPGLVGLEHRVALTRRQRYNVALVLVVAQLVQVGLIGLVVWAFFVLFGAVAVGFPVQQAWLGPLGIVEPLFGATGDHGVSRQLLRVATFLAGFSAFYAIVVASGDKVYREHFVEHIGHHVRQTLAVRRVYLAARRADGLSAPDPLTPDRLDPGPIAPPEPPRHVP